MTLRLDPQLETELRLAAEEDRRSVHQTVVLAVETFLALRETAEVRADPEALRALAEARQAVQDMTSTTHGPPRLPPGRAIGRAPAVSGPAAPV